MARQGQITNKDFYKRFYPRISARVTAPFLLTIVLIAGIGVFIVTRLVAGSIQERLNNQLVDSAIAAKNAVVEIEDQQIATLRLMAFTDGVAEAFTNRDAAALDRLLRPLAANAGVDSVLAFDLEGHIMYQIRRDRNASITAYDASPHLTSVQSWRSVQNLFGAVDAQGDKYTDIIQDPLLNHTVYITAPVIDTSRDGVPVGGLSIGIMMDSLTVRISQQSLSELNIYSNDGQVLGTTFRSLNVTSLAIPPTEAEETRVQIQAGLTPVVEKTIGELDYQSLFATFDLRSEPFGLLMVALPSDFVAERIGVSRDTFALLFALLFAIVAGTGILVTRSIVRPVERLVDTTRAIRAGDLSRRVGLDTPDELGELSVSFDHMTDQLVARSREINRLYVAQLEQTAQREAVLTSISDAVIVMNPTGKPILLNPAAEHLLQKVQVDAEAFSLFNSLARRPDQLSEPQTIELVGGFYNTLATPVNMRSGELLGYVLVFHDITSIMEVERVKDEMILQLSHELRTPLTAARGYVEMVQMVGQKQLNEQSVGFIGSAVDHLSTLERMVNQVIDVSAIVSSKFTIDVDKMVLSDILMEVMDKMKPQIANRDLKLWSQILASADLPIDGDAMRLGQAFEHILRNSWSYTLPGGWIEVRAKIENGQAIVIIVDSGVGIDQDELEKVFERMYRGRSADAGPTDARGLGLGLYLAKQIIEAHNGTITLESEPNLGTTVTLQLPTRQRK